eukprot:Hpha_TRINITY_DN13114_c1_g1::TRINITY_DN13114_c1_g1_i1::g.113450::m.113450
MAGGGDMEREVVLEGGVRMPRLGFGLSHNEGGFDRDAVLAAMRAGVRLFDTAARYGTEEALGEAMRASGVPREEFFITSKLWPADAGNVRAAYEASCRRVGVERLDLYLCHWPGMGGDDGRLRVWRDMEQLLAEGRVRAIGVSNYLEHHLKPLLRHCKSRPAVNQIELNPFQHPQGLVEYCRGEGIQVEGYCPLGKGQVLTHPELARIARGHQRSPAQVLLRWSLQHNAVTIPKTRNPEHAVANTQAWDFALTDAEMREMDGWHENLRVTWDPSGVA